MQRLSLLSPWGCKLASYVFLIETHVRCLCQKPKTRHQHFTCHLILLIPPSKYMCKLPPLLHVHASPWPSTPSHLPGHCSLSFHRCSLWGHQPPLTVSSTPDPGSHLGDVPLFLEHGFKEADSMPGAKGRTCDSGPPTSPSSFRATVIGSGKGTRPRSDELEPMRLSFRVRLCH